MPPKIAYALAICVILSCTLAHAADKPAVTVPKALPPKASLEKTVWEGFYTAQVWIWYHQGYAAWWSMWSRISQTCVVILGVTAFVFPFLIASRRVRTQPKWFVWTRWTCQGVGILTFATTMVLLKYPFDDWYRDDAVLALRWQSVSNEWKRLRPLRETLSQEELASRVDAVTFVQQGVEGGEAPSPDVAYLGKCMDKADKSLGVEVASDSK
jgi:hypothetical protein